MDASRLRHFVEIQRPGGTQDAVGQRDTDWETVAIDCAAIEPLTGREEFLAAQRQATTSHLITIRYYGALAVMNAAWRIKFGERIFTIDALPRNVDERNIWLVLNCTEGPRHE